MAASKPTFEVFRDLPFGSIQKHSYLWLRPSVPTGDFQFQRLMCRAATPDRMAGVVGFEPTQHTGSKPAALPTRLHPSIYSVKAEFSQGTLIIVLPIVRFSKLLAGKMGLEPITHKCVFAVCAFILCIYYIIIF